MKQKLLLITAIIAFYCLYIPICNAQIIENTYLKGGFNGGYAMGELLQSSERLRDTTQYAIEIPIIAIYPNPTNDEFTVEFNSTDLIQQQVIISITNILGDEVFYEPFETFSGKLTEQIILNQPAGVYIIKIIAGENQYERKILIE